MEVETPELSFSELLENSNRFSGALENHHTEIFHVCPLIFGSSYLTFGSFPVLG